MIARSAEVARPWRREDGPAPHVQVYPHGARPLLNVRVGSTWRRCAVRARYDWPTGSVSYQVEVPTRDEAGPGTVIRSYWWDAKSMRPVSGRGELG